MSHPSTSSHPLPASSRTSIPLSVSTRSMSRSASSTLTSKSTSLPRSQLDHIPRNTGAPNPTVSREPLGNALMNERGKRKAQSPDGWPRKVVRLEKPSRTSMGEGIRYPTTPYRVNASTTRHWPATNVACKLGRIVPSGVSPDTGLDDSPLRQPTPARVLLRLSSMDMDEDAATSSSSESRVLAVPSPPTPPKVHDRTSARARLSDEAAGSSQDINSGVEIDRAARVLQTPKRSTGPEGIPRSIRPIESKTMSSATTSIRRAFGISQPVGASRIPVPSPAISRQLPPTPSGGSGLLSPPTQSTVLMSPRRVLAGMSRLGMASPVSREMPSFARPISFASTRAPAVEPTERVPIDTMGTGAGNLQHRSSTASLRVAQTLPDDVDMREVREIVATHVEVSASSTDPGRKISKASLSRSDSQSRLPLLAAKPPRTSLRKVSEHSVAREIDVEGDTASVPKMSEEKAVPLPVKTMPPPSRIPTTRTTRAMQLLPQAAPIGDKSTAAAAGPPPGLNETSKQAARKLAALPRRRPGSRPTMTSSKPSISSSSASLATSSSTVASVPAAKLSKPIRRKPSYPSSLGHGPPAHQTPRMVSVPVPSHIIDRTSPMDVEAPLRPVSHPSPRSVSDPAPRNRLSLSMSTRREGWMDSSKSLVGLSEALERLKVKKEVEPTRRPSSSCSKRQSLIAVPLQEHRPNPNLAASTSSRLAAVHKPRYNMAITITGADTGATSEVEDSPGDKSLAAIMCSTSGGACLEGVVAFVDVFTADGTDSSAVFVDMLRSLGAKVLGRPTESLTHIIYKSGRPSTLAWYRKQADPPHIVGISWVTKSKEAGKRILEDVYRVEVGEEEVFGKRRKSMEPRALGLMNLAGSGLGLGRPGFLSANVVEARRRSSMHLPKISSPLKKGYARNDSDTD